MKKRLALAAAFAFSIIPFTSFADHLEPDESEIKKVENLLAPSRQIMTSSVKTFSDDILIAAFTVGNYVIEPGANLIGASLRNADLSGANLRNADLSGADLRNADLSGADLRNANLYIAKLSDADLSGADLTNANFFNADLDGAELSDVKLSGADLRNTDLSGANLSGVDLSNANLNRAILTLADLSGANLDGVNLISANVTRADLSGASLRNARLDIADLRVTDLSGADLSGAALRLARFSASTDFSGADLTGISGTDVNGCTSLLPEGWVCGGDPVLSLTYDESLLPPKPLEPEFFTFKPFLVNKKVKVFNNSLPYQIECFDEEFLKISLSDNGKFLVQLDEKNKYDGFDFKKAGKKFKKTYKKCSLPTTQPDGSPWPTTQPVNPNPNQFPINF